MRSEGRGEGDSEKSDFLRGTNETSDEEGGGSKKGKNHLTSYMDGP